MSHLFFLVEFYIKFVAFQVKKPANLKDIQLITAKNSRYVFNAGVQELSKEEFEQFNVSK